MYIKIVLINLIFLCLHANASKILGIFPFYEREHFDFFEPLMKALAKRGHDVTVISHFPQEESITNYTDVAVNIHNPPIALEVWDIFRDAPFANYLTPMYLAFSARTACEKVLRHTNVRELLESDDEYDLVIVEIYSTRCFLGLANKFGGHVIGVSSSMLLPWNDAPMGIPNNPSYIPNSLMAFTDQMGFLERLENTILFMGHHLFHEFFIDFPDNWDMRSYLGRVPDTTTLAINMSMILTNTHFSLTHPRPSIPSLVEVGGLHIEAQKPLPENIEKWINESTHGVIYFSLGSMIKGHTFPDVKRQMFLRVFGSLPQRVLWKWETEMLGRPDNVMIENWMPQFDILCHPNVKAFISHGGLLGTTEAVHCGVPMIIMPQFGDQFTNAKAVEASGGGVILDFRGLSEEAIQNALQTVLDPSFNTKAKELSARFRDRPLPPLDTAIYWVEYVARHGGAPHLKTAAVGMPLYKYLLLDVALFLTIVAIIFAYIQFLIAKWLFAKVFGTTSAIEKVKKS